MNRRDFLKTAAASATAPTFAAKRRATRKPNLLFIWTDEQRADTMAAYGNKRIHTPNLNKLAAQSVVFESAYVTQPVCTPNRAAVMTGLWPHQTGCTKNNIPLAKSTPTLPELLNDPDYSTAYMGKWHLGDEIFAQHGFDEWVSMEDGYSAHYGPDKDRSRRSDYHHFLVEKGYKPDRGDKFSRGFAARRPIEHCKPKFLELNACDFLRRNRNNPFVLYVNFLEPHMPFFGPLDDEHDPDKVTLPANFDDPLEENEPLRCRVKREACIANYGSEETDIRGLIARYWGLVTQVDRSAGKILDTLDELGLSDNTIVVYTSDHGDMMGAHRLVEKSVMYEEAVRIPWLMRVPGIESRRVDNCVSQIDMVPTLLDLMNCRTRRGLPGKSLRPLMEGESTTPEDIFMQWNPDSGAIRIKRGGTDLAGPEEIKRVKNESSRTVITPDGWKLVLSNADKSQLYNLRKDPSETKNLFYSGGYEEIVEKLRRKIHRWQKQVKDSTEV